MLHCESVLRCSGKIIFGNFKTIISFVSA